jgi:hypothetical protein
MAPFAGDFSRRGDTQETLEQAKYLFLLIFKAFFAIQADQASPAWPRRIVCKKVAQSRLCKNFT